MEDGAGAGLSRGVLVGLDHGDAHAAVRGKGGPMVGQEVVREGPDLVFHQAVDDPLGFLAGLGVPGQELDHEIQAGPRTLNPDADGLRSGAPGCGRAGRTRPCSAASFPFLRDPHVLGQEVRVDPLESVPVLRLVSPSASPVGGQVRFLVGEHELHVETPDSVVKGVRVREA